MILVYISFAGNAAALMDKDLRASTGKPVGVSVRSIRATYV